MEHYTLIKGFKNTRLANTIKQHSKIAIITDDVIANLYVKDLIHELTLLTEVHHIQHAPGENNKTRETKAYLEDQCASLRLKRSDAIIGFGGGLTLDLAGFVASTYHRGLSSYYIPTTLVACVDACLGGKVAINTSYGKNFIGTFYPAKHIFIPEFCLKSLDKTQIISGYMEAIKTFALDPMKRSWSTFKGNQASLIQNCLDIKSYFIQQDPLDLSCRKFLNFGHTIGHAIEKASDYGIPHGIAVGHGMILECLIMHHLNQCEWNLVEKIIQYTQECYLPKIKLPDTQKLYHYITLDKKNTHCIELIHLRDWQVLDFKNPTHPIDYSKFNDSLHQIINTHPSLC